MTRELSFCVFTTHQVEAQDATPLRMVSEARLAQLEAAELALQRIAELVGHAGGQSSLIGGLAAPLKGEPPG